MAVRCSFVTVYLITTDICFDKKNHLNINISNWKVLKMMIHGDILELLLFIITGSKDGLGLGLGSLILAFDVLSADLPV